MAQETLKDTGDRYAITRHAMRLIPAPRMVGCIYWISQDSIHQHSSDIHLSWSTCPGGQILAQSITSYFGQNSSPCTGRGTPPMQSHGLICALSNEQGELLPLCSDAFSGWMRKDPFMKTHNKEAREATDYLFTKVIPQFVSQMGKMVAKYDLQFQVCMSLRPMFHTNVTSHRNSRQAEAFSCTKSLCQRRWR